VSARIEWARENPEESKWMEEMMIRKELGGYCPKDPLKFAFISTIIGLASNKYYNNNTENRLKSLINRSK
ncbi:hypothetical protein LCGC14_2480240, partial [marine sediment metagenome]